MEGNSNGETSRVMVLELFMRVARSVSVFRGGMELRWISPLRSQSVQLSCCAWLIALERRSLLSFSCWSSGKYYDYHCCFENNNTPCLFIA
jgi:hypothetical protein